MGAASPPTLCRRLAAEALGTAFLLATVVGSGIMGVRLAGGSVGLALLANSVATGAILVVLIVTLGPVSGAHFNPAVTLAFALRRALSPGHALLYVAVQVLGAVAGVLVAHAMFEDPAFGPSTTIREGNGQLLSEFVATFGLVAFILAALRSAPGAVAAIVGLYIAAAYWFTASTSFANPAVTLARAWTDTFAGIRPADAPAFVLLQFVGAAAAALFVPWLLPERPPGTAP